MKKLQLLIFCCCLYVLGRGQSTISGRSAFESELPEFQKVRISVLKTNPLAMIISQIPIAGEVRGLYERMLSANQSTMVGVSYNFPNFLMKEIIDSFNVSTNLKLRMSGFRFQAAYKFYLFGQYEDFLPQGFYLGPHASYNYVKLYEAQHRDAFLKVTFTNVSLIAGYQVLIAKTIAIDTYIGGGYKYNFDEVKNIRTAPVSFSKISGDPGLSQFFGEGFKFSLAVNVGWYF